MFDVPQRAKLMEQCPQDQKGQPIPWTADHQWYEPVEREKINKTLSYFGIDNERNEGKHLASVMLEMGCNLAQEFTQELYNLLVRVYLSLEVNHRPRVQADSSYEALPTTERERLESLTHEVHSNCKGDFFFLSFMFKKHIQLTSKPQKEVSKPFTAYFTFIS